MSKKKTRFPGMMAAGLAASIAAASPARPQGMLFGSDAWRGHGTESGGARGCRVFSHFSSGDRLAFYAQVGRERPQRVIFSLFVSSTNLDIGGPPAETSVRVLLARLERNGRATPTVEAWVDDDRASAIVGLASQGILGFLIGGLDERRPARFFHALRDGRVLRVTIDGQPRAYQLRGTYSALSELVGCAFRARDGEVQPSPGMPVVASTSPHPPGPASPDPQTPATPTAMPPSPPPQLRERQTSSGSGIVVTRQGHILTNAHVTDRCSRLTVRRISGQEHGARLVGQDRQNDLAVLQASGEFPDAARIRIQAPRAGEQVVVYGFPLAGLLASSGNVTQGYVSALAGIGDDSRVIQISAPIQPGNSGGPILDMSGMVIGVVQSALDALRLARITGDVPQNVNFGIRAGLAAGFLAAHGVEPELERAGPQLSPPDVAARAMAVSVQILCYTTSP